MNKNLDVLVVAAENSAENYAAQVVNFFAEKNPDFRFFGLGGEKLRSAGMDVVVENSELAVVGIFEVLAHLLRMRRLMKKLEHEAIERKAVAALLVDFPDFNLRLAAKLRAAGIRVYFYISPTVWAWRYSRVKRIREVVDHLFIIFPFEKPIYTREAIPHTYIGHPLLAALSQANSRSAARKKFGLRQEETALALLPGSRPSEISDLVPVMLNALAGLRAQKPLKVFLLKARGVPPRFFSRLDLAAENIEAVEQENGHELMLASDLVLTTCGTSTLEAALLGSPLIALYKVNPLSYFFGRRLVRIDLYSIVNILANRWLVPELIQADCNPESLFREAARILADPLLRDELKLSFREIRDSLVVDKDPAEFIYSRMIGEIGPNH